MSCKNPCVGVDVNAFGIYIPMHGAIFIVMIFFANRPRHEVSSQSRDELCPAGARMAGPWAGPFRARRVDNERTGLGFRGWTGAAPEDSCVIRAYTLWLQVYNSLIVHAMVTCIWSRKRRVKFGPKKSLQKKSQDRSVTR